MATIFYRISLLILVLGLSASAGASTTQHFPRGTSSVNIPNVAGVRADILKNIGPIVEKAIAAGDYPGAVILAAHHGHIIYRGVFGSRRIAPNTAPMRSDTLFDIASLTKVVATTPAIMQLVEQGKLDLDALVTQYWPAFATNGKDTITIRELLTHTSGLPADISTPETWHGEAEALEKIVRMQVQHTPGTIFLYSDVNFIVLAYLVEIISGEHFDHYVKSHIIDPLAMHDTFFLPATALVDRIAPTEVIDNKPRWGVVNDPSAYAMGGVAGNAGLFSSASDLGIYAQCLLNNGRISNVSQQGKKQTRYLLSPLSILKMTSPQSPVSSDAIRGLGWDIDSAYSNRGDLFPVGSFGHTGWTGTSLWIDPLTQTWIIILTSRTHPTPAARNQLIQDRRVIANVVAASIVDMTTLHLSNTGLGELSRAYKSSLLLTS